jgi:hypothetical protein
MPGGVSMDDILTFMFSSHSDRIDKTALWTFAIVVVTFGGVIVAWQQLSKIRATSQADFTLRFIESFFKSETRTLYTLLFAGALKFEKGIISLSCEKTSEIFYFKVDQVAVNSMPDFFMISLDKKVYSDAEMDDFLLGYFETLGLWVKEKLIDFDFAYRSFSYYLINTYENRDVRCYLHEVGNIAYGNFRSLYYLFKERDKKLGRKRAPALDDCCHP